MRAAVQERYGPPRSVIAVRDVERPTPGPGQVLVRVHAAGVNISDAFMVNPSLFVRLASRSGAFRPKVETVGKDIAGVVEVVGDGVTYVRVGDEVFGRATRAFAEYACAGECDLLPKPASATFEEAAAVGISAMTAMQGIRDHGKVRPGQKVLINGASGGVGVYAVQIAKWQAAEVTGVCSTPNVALVRGLGADHVVDYTREDFTRGEVRYDVIFDNAASHSPGEYLNVLEPGGILLLNGGGIAMGRGDGVWRGLVKPAMEARRKGHPAPMPVLKWNLDDLAILKELVESGAIRPVIDRTFPLAQAGEALEDAASGRARGKIVIVI